MGQVAIKTAQLGVFYYTDAIPLEALFLESGRIEAHVFVSSWKSIPDANEATKQLPLGIGSVEELQVTAAAHHPDVSRRLLADRVRSPLVCDGLGVLPCVYGAAVRRHDCWHTDSRRLHCPHEAWTQALLSCTHVTCKRC